MIVEPSSRISTNFKIIPNSAPVVDFTYSSEASVFTFNSSASDAEGLYHHIVVN